MLSPGLQKKDLVNECQKFFQVSQGGGLKGSLVSQQCTTFKATTSGLHKVRDAGAWGPDSAGSHSNSRDREVQENHMSGGTHTLLLLHLLTHSLTHR